jgi:hypothetical protein
VTTARPVGVLTDQDANRLFPEPPPLLANAFCSAKGEVESCPTPRLGCPTPRLDRPLALATGPWPSRRVAKAPGLGKRFAENIRLSSYLANPLSRNQN